MDKRRSWIHVCLEEGLARGVLSPEDVLRHATTSVLATDLPPPLVASLLSEGLDRGTFDPALLVNHLGPHNLAEHVPLPVLWACLSEASGIIIREHPLTNASDEPIVPMSTSIEPDDQPEIEVEVMK